MYTVIDTRTDTQKQCDSEWAVRKYMEDTFQNKIEEPIVGTHAVLD